MKPLAGLGMKDHEAARVKMLKEEELGCSVDVRG